MIEPVPDKPDWFYVGDDESGIVRGLPGAGILHHKKAILHRSHLPLLNTDEAENYRAILTYYKQAWTDRERWADSRGFKFRTTQQQALDFTEPRKGVLIGDEMRLGKTLSALAAHDPNRGQLVIVAPLAARAVWLGWARRCFPELEIGVCISKKFDPELFNKPIVFCHYDIIHCWQAMTPIGTLIFDEAHLLTNWKTRRVNAAVVLQCRALKTIALTGTPIWNRPAGLWAVVGLVAPGAWGSYYDFGNRYGRPVSTGYGVEYTGSSNEAELNCRLQEIMIRRLWRDCAEDLPAISRSVVVAEVSDADRRKLDILAGSLKSERTNTAGNLASYRRQVAGVKAGVAVKEARKILDRGEPVVIWTYHRDLAESLHEALGNEHSYLIHGEIAPAERERRMDAWKTDPLPNALIATMAVAQVGIDLSHARIAIFVEIDYTPAVLGQAEMRTFALGRPMDILFIVANHLVDQRIIRALVAKLASADSLNVGAAVDAIDALRDAVMGAQEVGDVDRLLEDFLASAA